ncbi:iron-siderophore ABC transporter substrate-binding protein [Photobacterium rosenbergii]|uniref:Iron-siderophore ABC transporter substrate-binding protein n=1 Tax=Photobacterium rosenbergii TaxID=294936 RepID=A0ABU3ZH13_9GAMM|nr:iron-siderophore ABC transporter substrate-binding protein [Photobacterium rosenbergii]MDV5169283.1 iron-siderophore ABC transporter substrate-binding protein [Photobacterium rosenbergii]
MRLSLLKIRTFTLLVLLCFAPIQQVFAAVEIEDGQGTVKFDRAPERVVVLNWDILEQVLALDVVPVGAPNLADYRQWVVKPAAPESIQDIGSRSEPNLEKIASLHPDVIIAASPQKDLLPILKQIAPVVFLPNFSEHDNAAKEALAHLALLGKLFNKEALAKQRLAEIEYGFETLRNRLAAHFELPLDVVVMRFSTPNSVFIYTEHSTTQYVVEKLGLNNPIVVEPKPWGVKQERINRLQFIEEGYVLYVQPFPQADKLNESMLWQAMPFVKKGHFNDVRSVWNYGGALSLLYMAEAITDSLMKLAPTP